MQNIVINLFSKQQYLRKVICPLEIVLSQRCLDYQFHAQFYYCLIRRFYSKTQGWKVRKTNKIIYSSIQVRYSIYNVNFRNFPTLVKLLTRSPIRTTHTHSKEKSDMLCLFKNFMLVKVFGWLIPYTIYYCLIRRFYSKAFDKKRFSHVSHITFSIVYAKKNWLNKNVTQQTNLP